MILQQVLVLLRERGIAGISEIAAALGSDPDVVRTMLRTLQRKGMVERYRATPGCGSSCRGCGQADVELYCLAGTEKPMLQAGCTINA